MRGLCPYFGLVFLHPAYFRGGKARDRGIGGDLRQPFFADDFRDLVAFSLRALIAPDNAFPENAARFVEQNEPVHLPR